MKQGLSLRVSQHLTLTPQLQQAIRLLQMSTLELNQEVQQMLEDNPFLEMEEGADDARLPETSAPQGDAPPGHGDDGQAPSDEADGGEQAAEVQLGDDFDASWENDGSVDADFSSGEWGADETGRGPASANADDDADPLGLAACAETLTGHLRHQAMALRLDDEDSAALRFLIESLDDDGYLSESLEDLALALAEYGDGTQQVDEMIVRLEIALKLLQSLEPVGVGARDLGECLQLQLRALQQADDMDVDDAVIAAAQCICGQGLQWMARRDLRRLAQLCGADSDVVRQAMTLITALEPRPGRRFAAAERNIIVPDVIVQRSGSGARARFQVQINPQAMPRLQVHDLYANAIKSGGCGAALQQRVQEARWFVRNIQQRFETILRVSQAIVRKQKNFFIHGEVAMRPLVLREIAGELGLHESTISRVTTAKYMATPSGTYELKYFFGSSLATETGGNASSTAVRALIRQFIGGENPARPLSDSKISDLLREQGIECARRTVAKYREGMQIPTAQLRRSLQG